MEVILAQLPRHPGPQQPPHKTSDSKTQSCHSQIRQKERLVSVCPGGISRDPGVPFLPCTHGIDHATARDEAGQQNNEVSKNLQFAPRNWSAASCKNRLTSRLFEAILSRREPVNMRWRRLACIPSRFRGSNLHGTKHLPHSDSPRFELQDQARSSGCSLPVLLASRPTGQPAPVTALP
jgi:hypothetical protein